MIKPKFHSAEIRLIGTRDSGKTTYLATLAYCPSGLKKKYPELRVWPRNDDTKKKLSDVAEDILKRGLKLAPTPYDPTQLHTLAFYDFLLKIPAIKQQPKIDIELTARDFPGEFFHDISNASKWSNIKAWIEDLLTVTGWIVMVTDWEPGRDKNLYKPAFTKLWEIISEQEKINSELKNLRIAVVMAKCERGELWPCRLDADEDLFDFRLPHTYAFLTQKFSPERLQFFACSAFGILSDRREDFDPRPNCYVPDDGSSEEINAYLRNPTSWYPYGLIPPIYWLATGIRIEE